MDNLKIEYLPVEDLVPYQNNARKHTNTDVSAIAKSIEMFGFDDPIGIWKGNVIIEGHGRLMAAKQLGMETVPVIRLDHLTDEERRSYALVHNKSAELSEWDDDMLSLELEDLFDDFDMADFGFDLDLDDEDVEIVEDEVPEEAETRCKFGDLWQLGGHRLICGDSTDVAVIDRLMDGVKADCVFTDPPYGMKKESEGVLNDNLNFDDLLDFNRQWIPLTFGALKDNGSWYCWGIDEPLMDIYSNILKPMAKENKITFRNLITWDKGNGQGQLSEDYRMYPIADEKCLFVMCGVQGFNNNADNYYEAWDPIRRYLADQKQIMGWNDDDVTRITGVTTVARHCFGRSQWEFPTEEHYNEMREACRTDREYKAFKREYEEIKREYEEIKREWYSTRAYFDNTHDNQNNVWHFDRAGKDEREHTGGHATPKPIALCSRAIKSSSREGEIVLDVFGGSGSTLIACEQLNRKCYMCELDEHYCDVIIQRWENLTGEKAEKL